MLVFLVLVFGVRSCRDAQEKRSFEDYGRDTAALVRESGQQSEALFRLLDGSDSGGDVDVENQLNALARTGEQIVTRAQETETPDELQSAQDDIIETFELRRDGLRAVARDLPTAIAAQQDQRNGTARIAASMQNFLASDVIYQTRAQPAMRSAFEAQELSTDRVPDSKYLPEIDWLDPTTVADRVGQIADGGGGEDDEEAAPGLHGNGLAGVSIAGQELAAGGSASITAGGDLTAEVQVVNQGENTETDVPVRISIGSGGDAIEAEGTLDEIAAGETKTVEVPIEDTPPTGQSVPITVTVEAVPGEDKTDNNEEQYSAIFTS